MTPNEIITEYMHREAAAGGLPCCEPRDIEGIARDFNLDFEHVRNALLDDWAPRPC